MNTTKNYGWNDGVSHCHNYIDRILLEALEPLDARNVLDVGCGNGSLTGLLQASGYEVTGCEPDENGLEIARKEYPKVTFVCSSVYDEPEFKEGTFDAVVSTEVIEHLYAPEALPRYAAQVLKNGGHLIISTPYHGYLKNLLLALLDKWDFHHHPGATGMHIKFFSRATLSALLAKEGFTVTDFIGCGRLPYLWKSMMVIAKWNGVTKSKADAIAT